MRTLSLIIGVAAALTITACGDNPTSPNDEEDTGLSDVPELPTPETAGGDVPSKSETLASIRPLETAFRPQLVRAMGSWHVSRRECEYQIFPIYDIVHGPWQQSWSGESWSNEIPEAPALPAFGHDLLLLNENGSPVSELAYQYVEPAPQFTYPGMEWDERWVQGTLEPLTELPHLRRDRWWELKQLGAGGGSFLLLIGESEGAIITTITSGSSKTETESFGRSISASVGASYGLLSASVEATLSESFSTSVTVYEERSETFEKRVRGKTGKTVQFMVWELVERYSFTDQDGEPFTDDLYEFDLPVLVRHGVATALQATEFDNDR